MPFVTVSDKGQVVIPVEIRRRLGITPGCQLDFSLDGHVIHAEVKRPVIQTSAEEGPALDLIPPGICSPDRDT